jgi:DNA-binding transcriptional ArsR family regulator
MGITKTAGFSRKINQTSEIIKAIGHPGRLKIIQYLMANPSCVCGDIMLIMPLAQSTVSKHIYELKKVGLIQGKFIGNNISYTLNKKTWQIVTDFLLIEIMPSNEE